MYGVAGERRLTEYVLDWLPGYEGSSPVRVGNAASGQFQLDVFGEVLGVAGPDARHGRRMRSMPTRGRSRSRCSSTWRALGTSRTTACGRCAASVSTSRVQGHGLGRLRLSGEVGAQFDLKGPIDRWRAIRDEIHAEVCAEGFDPELGAFTQAYGSQQLDASALFNPAHRLPAGDRPAGGEHDCRDRARAPARRLLLRYRTDETDDGLPRGEGVFLACSFWLVDEYMMQGREDEARALFDRLAALGQRRRPVRRGVRPDRQAPARQLPAGLHPPCTRARRRQALERRPVHALAEARGRNSVALGGEPAV